MMKDLKTVKVEDFPEWAVCHIVNGDDEGLSDGDKALIRTWVEQNVSPMAGCSVDTEKRNEFCSHPEFGLACATYPATFLVRRNHYLVSFKWPGENDVFCTNLAYGTPSEIRDRYSKYTNVSLRLLQDSEVERYKERSMPMYDCSQED